MNRAIALFGCVLATFAVRVCAEPYVYFAADQIPDPDHIAQLLLGAPDDAPGVVPSAANTESPAPRSRTRSFKLIDPSAATGATTAQSPQPVRQATEPTPLPARFRPNREIAAATPAAVANRIRGNGRFALPIQFGFDSSHMVGNASAQQLDAVAEGIKRLPANIVVVIEGHTDAYGVPVYNTDLSLRRALAVRAYLVARHRIPGSMLVAVGRGQADPINASNAYAPENRRVEFRADYEVAMATNDR